MEIAMNSSEDWFLLRTQARREIQVHRFLRDHGVDTYLPLENVGTKGGAPIREPFFPTYLFFHFRSGDLQLPLVRWAPGSRQIVSFDQEPAPVPGSLVDAIRQRLERRAASLGPDPFRPGDTVKIVSGSFTGLDAIFDARISGTRRAVILIEMVGRQIRAQIPIEQLRAKGAGG